MHVSYVYKGTIPSQQAAFIQILNTMHALGERGVTATVYTGPHRATSEADLWAHYGLTPHPNVTLRVLYPEGWRQPLFWPRLYRLAQMEGARSAGPGRPVIISRGEPGLNLFHHLRRIPQGDGPLHVYEAHRPCFTQVRRWYQPSGPLAEWRTRRMVRTIYTREKAAVEQADGLICLTHGVEAALHDLFGARAPALILPSGTAPPPNNVPGDEARDIDIFYAGKLRARKGVYDLVRAMVHLEGRTCWIAGGSADEVVALRKEAEALGVADRVRLLGYIEPSEIRGYYLRARVGVCPLPAGVSDIAEQYTSPLKVLQMMACGVPVVATRLPAIEEVLTHDHTAYLCAPSDPEALARAMQHLLSNRSDARRLADAARAEVEQYTWNARARRLHEFLQAL